MKLMTFDFHLSYIHSILILTVDNNKNTKQNENENENENGMNHNNFVNVFCMNLESEFGMC